MQANNKSKVFAQEPTTTCIKNLRNKSNIRYFLFDHFNRQNTTDIRQSLTDIRQSLTDIRQSLTDIRQS